MDRPTEDRLYKLFRDFFQQAEIERRWNLWNDFAWDTVGTNPSPALVAAVTRAYHDELFLPDYSARALYHLRSSRGRAWFLTRWTYEEGKHLLVLAEWLMRSGSYTNDELRAQSDRSAAALYLGAAYEDAPAVLADFLLWELKERDRYRALRKLAVAEGDEVLAAVWSYSERRGRASGLPAPEPRDHRRDVSEQVADAARRIAANDATGDDGPAFGNALLADLTSLPNR
jgi:hypothetical protein